MKRIISYITLLASTVLLAAGCNKDTAETAGAEGEGRLVFSINFDGIELTRAVDAPAPAAYTVKIGKPGLGSTHIFDQSNAPTELWLVTGEYFIEVTGGEFAAPGFEAKYGFKGYKEFQILNNQDTPVEVVCKVATTLITVSFDENIGTWLENYNVTLFPVPTNENTKFDIDAASVAAAGGAKTLYFNLASGQTSVKWAFGATHKNEAENPTVSEIGSFTGLEPGKEYTAKFRYTYSEKKGKLALSVTVDETTVDVPTTIIIHMAPSISAPGVNFANPVTPVDGQKIKFEAAGTLSSIKLTGSIFGSTGYETIGAADLADYGLGLATINSGYEMTLAWRFFELVGTATDTTPVTITVTDENGRSSEVTFSVAAVATSIKTLSAADVWAKHAYVSGTALAKTSARFAYRTSGGSDWNYVTPTIDVNQYVATLKNLTPETQYEVAFEVDGVVGTTQTFTTGAATPLYNGGFEFWHTDSDVVYANGSGDEKFWDSGNYGTVKAPMVGKPANNITTESSEKRPGSAGSKSARLKSNWFGLASLGAFAAGNLYTGNFLEARADLSNPSGRVEFGRPFTGRPSAMSVWYKATTGNVNYAKNNAPLSVGQKDMYRIVVALSDRGSLREVDTANWDTILNFATDPDIIAWGDILSSADVDWTNATIPLKYNSTTRIPTHIIVLASASAYGDYFTGSTSSEMFIDDFELIYDENIVLQ